MAFMFRIRLLQGGETRFHSVKNGLELIPGEEGLVGVHDGVRPFVSAEVIAECYRQAESREAVVPVIDVVETVRRLLPDGGSETVLAAITGLCRLPRFLQ